MEYNCNSVVLIKVLENTALKVCESIEGMNIEDFSDLEEIKGIDPENILVYSLSDFMDLVNTEELDNFGEYFISFVWINPNPVIKK